MWSGLNVQIVHSSLPNTSSPSNIPTKDSKDRCSLGIILHGSNRDRRALVPKTEGLHGPNIGEIKMRGREIIHNSSRAKAVEKAKDRTMLLLP